MENKTKDRILVGDIEAATITFFKSIFKKQDYIVDFLTAEDDFLKTAVTNIPDLIFLATDMGGMDGFTICQNMKMNERLQNIPVVFLSETLNPDIKSKVFDSGGLDIVIKPIETNEILMKTKIHIGFNQFQKQTEKQLQKIDKQSDEIKALETRQQALREKLKSLTHHVPMGILRTKPDGRILDANPALFNLVGYKSLSDISNPMIQGFYYNKEDRKKFLEKVTRGEVTNLELRFRKKDDSPVWCSISSVLQENVEDGVYYLSSVQDITERKKIEEEKANLFIQLTQTEKMASIGQLAAGVAHEINNPVGFVSSNLNSLEDYLSDLTELIKLNEKFIRTLQETEIDSAAMELKHEIRKFSTRIDLDFLMKDIGELMNDCQEGLDRISNIVVDLKDFAHPGKKDPELVNVNVGIASTLNVITSELKYKAKVFADYEVVPMIMAVPQQINQVFLSILVNAAQAIDKTGEITIKTYQEKKDVVIEISDTGCGIPAEDISKVFDPFFTTKEIGKGTGLGMNIAYNIIEQHRGSIMVKSQVDKGTTFIIKLPVFEGKE